VQSSIPSKIVYLDINKHSTLRCVLVSTLSFCYTTSCFGFTVTWKLSMFEAKCTFIRRKSQSHKLTVQFRNLLVSR
jgi:hypothetical protein